MSIKVRLALVFMGLSLLLLLGTLGYIRTSQEVSRREEFFERLRDHAHRIAGLLGEVEAADRDRLELLGLHSIHQLYDEKVLVFNGRNELVYSSLDNEPIAYSNAQLEEVRAGGGVAHRDADGDEVVGVHHTANGQDLVVLASAYDRHGRQELRNLTRTLWVSLALGSVFIFAAGYFYIGLVFRPVERLNAAIAGIGVDKLDQRLPVRDGRDEIGRLAQGYNQMLDRLREAFDLQRAFVNNASHELRTPLARMNAQVERALGLPAESPELPAVLRTLKGDIIAQASLVESLLLLQRLQAHIPAQRSPVRVDEALFATLDEVRVLHPRLHAEVDIAEGITDDRQVTVPINELLLRTALRNLLVNAAIYAPDQRVRIRMEPVPGMLRLTFSNAGEASLPQDRVFEPFFRGAHRAVADSAVAKPSAAREGFGRLRQSAPASAREVRPGRIKGNGLGLSIVKQVVEQAGGTVRYEHDGRHGFEVRLPTA